MIDFDNNNRLYQHAAGYGTDWHCFTVNGLNIPISAQWNNIAINLSGGADSACLALLLCEHIQSQSLSIKLHVVSFIRCWETRPWQGPIALAMYQGLQRRYPEIIGDRHQVYFPPELEMGVSGIILDGRSGDQIIGGSYNRYLCMRLGMDAVYNATSQNPNVDPPWTDRVVSRDLQAADADSAHVIWPFVGTATLVCRPFAFVQKDWIMAQYQLFGARDLLSMTRSCEGDLLGELSDVLDIKTYSYDAAVPVPLCNRCFWCRERTWAELRCDAVVQDLRDSGKITHER